MYNVKSVTYQATGEQDIFTYKNPVMSGGKRTKKEVSEELEMEFPKELTPEELQKNADRSLKVSLNRTVNKVYDYARANVWEWFITWTLDPKKIDRYDYKAITDKLSKWLDNTRQRKAPDLKYIIVPEKHKDGAYHFHGLLSHTGELEFIDSGKKTKTKDKIYNLEDWTLGFTTATKVKDTLKASNYITKYITKELMNDTKGQRRYWNSKNLDIGLVETDVVLDIENIHNALKDEAKRHKIIDVNTPEYNNRINIFTI